MRALLLIALLSFLAGRSAESLAQRAPSDYRYTYVSDWPPELRGAVPADDETRYGYDLLPFIDSLALGYAYAGEAERPFLAFLLSWTPGPYGVLDNRLVPYEALPEDVRIVAVYLRARVFVDHEPVAYLRLALDSLMLGPVPDQHAFIRDDRAWDAVFEDLPAEEARAAFRAGFTLGDLEIERIAFASFEPPPEDEEPDIAYPRYPPHVGVYPPHVGIWVDWIIRPGPSAGKRGVTGPPREPREGVGRDVPSPADRTRTREGEDRKPGDDRTGRTETGDRDEAAGERSGKTSRPKGKSDKDKDDDDRDLLPAALAGAAAVGALAVLGGTIGYYGNTGAPLGLASGFVRAQGGVLVQVAVNGAVLGAGDEREKLVGKVTVFYDFFRAPVQPAFGFGVLAEEAGDDVDLSPSLTLGAVGNFGRLLLFGGYDLAAEGVDFGVAFNFKGGARNR